MVDRDEKSSLFTLSKLIVIVVIAVAATVFSFVVLGFIAGIAWFLFKVAFIAVVIAAVVLYIKRK